MKKKFLLAIFMVMIVSLFAFSVSAAEPDKSREAVTLTDGTVCPIWDTDGNGLIWYITATDEAGVNTYAYVSATSGEVDYMGSWTGTVYGETVYEVNKITITVDGVSYGTDKMVVVNMKKDVVLTSNKHIGEKINCFSKSFTNSKSLQYIYIPVDTVAFQSETFKSCSNLQYINFEELTELRKFTSQELNGCTSLFANGTLDLSKTQLVEVGKLTFHGSKCEQIILPNTVQIIGDSAFQSCKNLTRVDLPDTITSLSSFNYTFDGCSNLETITGLDAFIEKGKLTSFGAYAFNGCKKLKNIDGLMTNGILIIPEGVTSLGNLCFAECDQIRFVEFPSTINYVGQAAFSFCDNLTLVSFDKVDAKIRNAIANGESYTKVTFNNCGTFKSCPKLLAMCVPAGTTDLINRFIGSHDNRSEGCVSLTAVYLPDSIKSFGINGGKQGPFCGAINMYFVSEPFTVSQCLVDGEIDLTKLNLPAKPKVYFMPESLTTTHGHVYTNQYSKDGTLLQDCKNVNDVIVFGEKYVDFNARNAFQGMGTADSPKTVVFLGDMTQFVTTKNAQYVNLVFANKADKSPEDLGILDIHYDQNNTDSFMYFCYDGSRYDYRISKNDMANYADITAKVAAVMATKTSDGMHVANPNLAEIGTAATCISNAFGVNYCFCGANMGESEIEGTILGHSHTIYLGIVYESYMQDGCYATRCDRCDDVLKGDTVSAIFSDFGYSATEKPINGKHSMVQCYKLNKDAYNVYVAQNEGFEFGVVVSVSNDPLNPANSGLIDANQTYITEQKFIAHDYFDIGIVGIGENQTDVKLVFCAYVIDNGEIFYLDGGETVKVATAKSHDDLAPKAE